MNKTYLHLDYLDLIYELLDLCFENDLLKVEKYIEDNYEYIQIDFAYELIFCMACGKSNVKIVKLLKK